MNPCCQRKISILGAGNMGFRLGIALAENGCCIEHVWNRTAERGEKLAKALQRNQSNASYTNQLSDLYNSDILILAVSDDAITPLIDRLLAAFAPLRENNPHCPIVLHTSGATAYSVFEPLLQAGYRCGVFYPLMTLSRTKNVNFMEIPLLFETEDEQVKQWMSEIAFALKAEYLFCDSAKRLRMHTAAVFACNFVNYILGLAFEVAGNSHTFLMPLAWEMLRKAFLKTPWDAQTGPAIRGDRTTIEKHLQLLKDLNLPEEEELYRLLTERIAQRFQSGATGYYPEESCQTTK